MTPSPEIWGGLRKISRSNGVFLAMHFYTEKDGVVLPRHFVEMTSRPGELRPSRMSDFRAAAKRGEIWQPSVSTVRDVLAKPALTNWIVGQHLKQAWHSAVESETTDPADGRNIWLSQEQWIAEICRLTELEMDRAPTAGSDLHKSLELYFNYKKVPDADFILCKTVYDHVRKYALGTLYTEERFITDGYGGQVDLSNQDWVIDYKSKQTAAKWKPGKMVYDEHTMQLAAYRKGLKTPKARCANVFICIENGEIDFHEHSEAELERGWKLFEHALAIWNLQNRRA